jgi:phosphatidylserine decarboxylase
MAREGYPFVFPGCAAAILFLAGGYLSGIMGLYYGGAFLSVLTLFFAYFFRDPEREIPGGENDIVSPGDGHVVSIVEEDETYFINGQAKRISIFLSVFDVHVNRIPIGGKVDFLKYKPGSFKAAFKEDASSINEQSIIGITSQSGKRILFKQIAGLIARRIIFRVQENQLVTRGDRFGLIRFGSRVDVSVPPEVEILVKKGQRVYGGKTLIGRISNEK